MWPEALGWRHAALRAIAQPGELQWQGVPWQAVGPAAAIPAKCEVLGVNLLGTSRRVGWVGTPRACLAGLLCLVPLQLRCVAMLGRSACVRFQGEMK